METLIKPRSPRARVELSSAQLPTTLKGFLVTITVLNRANSFGTGTTLTGPDPGYLNCSDSD